MTEPPFARRKSITEPLGSFGQQKLRFLLRGGESLHVVVLKHSENYRESVTAKESLKTELGRVTTRYEMMNNDPNMDRRIERMKAEITELDVTIAELAVLRDVAEQEWQAASAPLQRLMGPKGPLLPIAGGHVA